MHTKRWPKHTSSPPPNHPPPLILIRDDVITTCDTLCWPPQHMSVTSVTWTSHQTLNLSPWENIWLVLARLVCAIKMSVAAMLAVFVPPPGQLGIWERNVCNLWATHSPHSCHWSTSNSCCLWEASATPHNWHSQQAPNGPHANCSPVFTYQWPFMKGL